MAREDNKIKSRIDELKAQELTLFRSYNRHANADFKLSILSQISSVIVRIEELNNLLK